MEKSINLKKGDSVRVKKGIMCPDYKGLGIGGWQGRVSEITEDEDGGPLIGIRWDSVTLRNMPEDFIDHSESEGLAWTEMYLEPQEVEIVQPRDIEQDVADMAAEITKSHSWSWLGEQGKEIHKVLAGVDEKDEMTTFRAWKRHLEKKLVFPFEAEVSEYQERGPLQAGDRVRVERLSIVDDLYGIIVELRYGRNKYALPLCDLEVVDKDSPNYQPVDDYSVWFANR